MWPGALVLVHQHRKVVLLLLGFLSLSLVVEHVSYVRILVICIEIVFNIC